MPNLLLAFSCRFVSFLDRFGLGHVLPLLRRAVKTRTFPVVNMRLGIDPNKTMATARCRGVTPSLCAGAACRRRRGGRTGRSRSFGFEQIAEGEFASRL